MPSALMLPPQCVTAPRMLMSQAQHRHLWACNLLHQLVGAIAYAVIWTEHDVLWADARLVSETWGQGNASSLPQTSTNKSLPLHESEASLASDGQEAEYLTKVTHVADSLPSGLSIRRISMWGGCGVLVMGAVVLMYTLGRRLLQGRSGRMARRRSGMSSGRRHQRYSV